MSLRALGLPKAEEKTWADGTFWRPGPEKGKEWGKTGQEYQAGTAVGVWGCHVHNPSQVSAQGEKGIFTHQLHHGGAGGATRLYLPLARCHLNLGSQERTTVLVNETMWAGHKVSRANTGLTGASAYVVSV